MTFGTITLTSLALSYHVSQTCLFSKDMLETLYFDNACPCSYIYTEKEDKIVGKNAPTGQNTHFPSHCIEVYHGFVIHTTASLPSVTITFGANVTKLSYET